MPYAILVGEMDNHVILEGVAFVLVLEDQYPHGVVVSDFISPPLELDMQFLKVSLVLGDIDKPIFRHQRGFVHSSLN